jgi:hypothetical protein
VRSTPQAAALKIGRFSFGKMFRDEIGKRLDFLAFSDFGKNAQFRGYRVRQFGQHLQTMTSPYAPR